jgi:hypothetical protein
MRTIVENIFAVLKNYIYKYHTYVPVTAFVGSYLTKVQIQNLAEACSLMFFFMVTLLMTAPN